MPGRSERGAAWLGGEVDLKYCKRFTEGFGYFICFLIFVFLIYSYITFGEPFLDEDNGQMQTAMNNVKGFKEYFIMLGIFFVSSVVASATDRAPYIGIIVSAVPVYYVIKLYHDKMLVFLPMIIMILTLFFFAGEIVATAQWAREKIKKE